MHKSLDEFEIRPDARFTRPLVSMATDRVYSGKRGIIMFSLTFLIRFISYLQVMMIHKSLIEFKMWQDPSMDYELELAALERLKKNPIDL